MITRALTRMRRVRQEKSGQALSEYAIFLALITLSVVLALGLAGAQIEGFFTQTGNALANAAS